MTTGLGLVLTPLPSRPGHFSAHLDGRCVIRGSRQPFHDAARALAGEGVPAGTPIATRHAGSSIIAMCSTVGEASRWTVEESDSRGLRKRLWRPHPNAARGGAGAPENERGDLPGTNEPAGDDRASWAA